MSKLRQRLDAELLRRGFFQTRAKAQAAIMAGVVLVDGQVQTKAGQQVLEDAPIELLKGDCPFVSRGGLKLKAALEHFKLDAAAKICLDVGAATGGFSDCLLQAGAEKVYALDVGKGQMDDKLKKNPRLIFLQDTNARFLSPKTLPERPELAAMDVSFISLKLVLLPVLSCLATQAALVALVKPQFELTPEKVPGGLVKSDEHRQQAVTGLREFFAASAAPKEGWRDCGVLESPVRGAAKGNIEYLWLIKR
ncbi:MAG TPA: TlyA family RNA methyltransferase [Elusimicrobiales bacterium]|nr:TlyA family RNA methyltransferase [Elusimicrobiales bacterium]